MLQEVWFPAQSDLLIERLTARYEPIDTPRTWFPGRAGGLLTFVRRDSGWTVSNAIFEPFAATAPAIRFWEGDGLATKGFQRIELSRGSDRLICINTHLQAQYGPRHYTEVRTAQIRQLERAARTLDSHLPILAGGDFNTRPQEALYSELSRTWTDLTVGLRHQCKCGTAVPGDDPPEWIDYLFLRRSSSWTAHIARAGRIENSGKDDPYSDHDGLDIAVRIDPAPDLKTALDAAAALAIGGPSSRRQWLGGCALLALGRVLRL